MKIFSKAIAIVISLTCALSLGACSFQSVDGLDSSSGVEEIVTPDSVVIVPEGDNTQPSTTQKEVKYLRNKVEKAGRVSLEKNSECPADFVLNVEGDEPIRILQLTDTQMIDHTQVRLGNGAVTDYSNKDHIMYDIIDYVVEETKPDLILITGDYVYGDYDDNGSLFREQTDYFDSLGIYWAVIFGNHDNDSDSEYARWLEEGWEDWYARKQCQYLEASTHGLFRTRTQISGYSNFSIAIKQNGEFVRSVFMIDTHGSHQTAQEIKQIQLDWYKESVAAINAFAGKAVPQFICIHVPIYAFNLAAQQYGYVEGTTPNMEIPENDNGDFGFIRQNPGSMDKSMVAFNTFKNNGADAILAGHLHKNNSSILYQGVRMVFGTKSSRYDKYSEDLLGGTIFTVTGSAFTVAPVYYTGK